MPPAARRATTAAAPASTGLVTLHDVVDSDTMLSLVEGTTTEFMAISGWFGWAAPALQEKIEWQLRKEGLDTPGRFSFMPTGGARAAKEIAEPFFKIAEIQAECATLIQLAGRNWRTFYSEPRAAARALRDDVDVLGA
jgi:hypothetical protein